MPVAAAFYVKHCEREMKRRNEFSIVGANKTRIDAENEFDFKLGGINLEMRLFLATSYNILINFQRAIIIHHK